MGLFRGFDFGKSLAKQIDAFKRYTPQQRTQREPKLAKQVENFTSQFEKVVANPGSANPGLLKNAAEVLVDAAQFLASPEIVYISYTAMVARSRKVPVVPGLSGLVDRLLEIPTQSTSERVALLTWRIITGSLPPARYFRYLHERAATTDLPDDWKSFASGVGQTIKKGTLRIDDDMAIQALENLAKNKKQLGDQAQGVLLDLAEAMFHKKKPSMMERLLLEVAIEEGKHPPKLADLIDMLLDYKQDASWELHQYNLVISLKSYSEHPVNLKALLEKLKRGRRHKGNLIDFLLENEYMPMHEEISTLLVELILSESNDQIDTLINRWQVAHARIGTAQPESALILIREAVSSGRTNIRLPEPSDSETITDESKPDAEEQPKHIPSIELEPEPLPKLELEPENEPITKRDIEPETLPESNSEHLPETETESDTRISSQDDPITHLELAPQPEPELELESESDPAMESSPELDAESEAEFEPEPEVSPEPDQETQDEQEQPLPPEPEPEPEPQPESEFQPVLLDIDAIVESKDAGEFHVLIAQTIKNEEIASESATEVISNLQGIVGKEWIGQESILWIAEKLINLPDIEKAETYLSLLKPLDGQKVSALGKRVCSLFGSSDIPESIEVLLFQMQLESGDFQGVFNQVQQNHDNSLDDKGRLESLSEWLMQQADPGAEQLITLAQVQRMLLDDPQAGFQYASLASLKSPGDANIQNVMETWLEVLPADEIQFHKGRQATFLLKTGGKRSLIGVVLNSVDTIIQSGSEVSLKEPQEWLDEVRPLIEDTTEESQTKLISRWARLYLTCVASNGNQQELTRALKLAREKLNPYEATVLASTIGDRIPASAKFALEYFSLIGSGDWESALEFVAKAMNAEIIESIELGSLYEGIPEKAILTLSWRVNELLILHGDKEKRLNLLKVITDQLDLDWVDVGLAKELRSFFNQELTQLCSEEYEPAVRFRMDTGNGSQKPEGEAGDLIILSRQGDQYAQGELRKLFEQHVVEEHPQQFVQDIAECLGQLFRSDQPDLSLIYFARAGLAMGLENWAMERIDELTLVPSSPDGLMLMGQLAITQSKLDVALKSVESLLESGQTLVALPVISKLVDIAPKLIEAQLLYLRVLLSGSAIDFGLAMSVLFDISKVAQETGRHLPELLDPLKLLVKDLQAAKPEGEETEKHDIDVLELALSALTKDFSSVGRTLTEISKRDHEELGRLSNRFEELEAQKTELPPMLIVAWCKTLVVAGRIDEALSRSEPLRNHVSEYSIYIALLEQIKETGAASGANLSLGDAFVRLSLWERAASAYGRALDEDEHLAMQILAHLRSTGALELSVAKYPLHVLALRLISHGSNSEDWDWAVSTLKLLESEWNVADLFEQGKRLWEHFDQTEIGQNQLEEMLYILIRLAQGKEDKEAAANYLIEAYQLTGNVTPPIIEGLSSVGEIPDSADSVLKLWFAKLQFAAAYQSGDDEQVISSAMKIADQGDEERQLALEGLAEFLKKSTNHSGVQIARLQVLDPSIPEEQKSFIHILDEASSLQISQTDAKPIIKKVTSLLIDGSKAEGLKEVLIQLLIQFGDEARAWQLASGMVGSKGRDSDNARQAMQQIAMGEFAQLQRVILLAALANSCEYVEAASLLAGFDPHEPGEHVPSVVDVAETLIDTPGGESARRWLIEHYRSSDQTQLAADHLVWAKAAGMDIEAKWVAKHIDGEMQYRHAILTELTGNSTLAIEQMREARMTETKDPFIAVAIRLWLADIVEKQDNFTDALVFATEAVEIMKEHPMAQAKRKQLELEVIHKKIQAASQQEDSAERTVALAQLYQESGEYEKAIEELQDGLGRGQRSIEINIELAACFTRTGHLSIARRAFSDAFDAINAGKPNVSMTLKVLYGLSLVNSQMGDVDEAIKNLEQLSILQHDYLDAKAILDKLYQVQKAAAGAVGGETPKKMRKTKKKTTQPKNEDEEKESGLETSQLVDDILSLFGTTSSDEVNEGDDK